MFALLLAVSWVMGGMGWGEGVEPRTSHRGDRKDQGLMRGVGEWGGVACHCLPSSVSDESA